MLALLEQSRSVLVTGPAGVGKTAVIHGVATAIATAGGAIRQLSAADLLTGTRYIGEWQTKVRELVRAAKQAQGRPLHHGRLEPGAGRPQLRRQERRARRDAPLHRAARNPAPR